MRYFDSHLHFRSPDDHGVDGLLSYLSEQSGFVGGNLVLNTPTEVALAIKHRARIPKSVHLVPPYSAASLDGLSTSGWYKIHPSVHRVTHAGIADLVASVASHIGSIRGLMVHHFPWGADLEHNVALPLIVALARTYPQLPILATHGGGYESWHLRAHTGSLPNVHYDFSVTAAYYAGTDYLRPLKQYLERKKDRVVFGSDWPSGDAMEQLRVITQIGAEAGLDEVVLEDLLLSNALRLWPTSDETSSNKGDHG